MAGPATVEFQASLTGKSTFRGMPSSFDITIDKTSNLVHKILTTHPVTEILSPDAEYAVGILMQCIIHGHHSGNPGLPHIGQRKKLESQIQAHLKNRDLDAIKRLFSHTLDDLWKELSCDRITHPESGKAILSEGTKNALQNRWKNWVDLECGELSWSDDDIDRPESMFDPDASLIHNTISMLDRNWTIQKIDNLPEIQDLDPYTVQEIHHSLLYLRWTIINGYNARSPLLPVPNYREDLITRLEARSSPEEMGTLLYNIFKDHWEQIGLSNMCYPPRHEKAGEPMFIAEIKEFMGNRIRQLPARIVPYLSADSKADPHETK